MLLTVAHKEIQYGKRSSVLRELFDVKIVPSNESFLVITGLSQCELSYV